MVGKNEKTPLEKIEELKSLADRGIVTQEEFEVKKAELLRRI